MPKMPPDASHGSTTPAGDPVAIVKASGATHGWRAEEPLRQPDYLESEKLAPELAAAAKGGTLALAVVDETIEECSSAGGTHVLLKTELGLVHFGDHGVMLHPGPKKGDAVVVAFEKLPAPESIEKSAFCVPARTVVARATIVLPVARAADGERMIAELAK